MRHINFYFPEIVPFEPKDVVIKYDGTGTSHVSLKTEKTYRKLDPSFFDGVDVARPFTWENEAYENIQSDLPVILFLRDSYTVEWFIGKYIAQHFGKAIFIHNQDIENFEEYVTRYKPDIVVFESAERVLRMFADFVSRIPELP
jgi:hypothetical protein